MEHLLEETFYLSNFFFFAVSTCRLQPTPKLNGIFSLKLGKEIKLISYELIYEKHDPV